MNFLKSAGVGFNANNGAAARWEAKTVKYESPLSLDGAEPDGRGTISEINNMLILKTNAEADDSATRITSAVIIKPQNRDFRDYNRLSLWIYPKATGFHNFYFHITLFNGNNNPVTHAPSLVPNGWNHILWEIDDINRDSIRKLSVAAILLGTPDEARPDVEFYFRDFSLQKVDADYIEGWNLDDRVGYSHSGYMTNMNKIALTQGAKNNNFELVDLDRNLYINYPVQMIKTELGSYQLLDFTATVTPGRYAIRLDGALGSPFVIDDFPYRPALIKTIAFFKSLRCGDDVPGIHSPCHLNCYTHHPDGRSVSNHGGWHDAADVSQFEICTAEMVYAILEAAESLFDDDSLKTDILDEGRWGINWLLKTRFNDGHRALAVFYAIWRKNILNHRDEIPRRNVSENGPFENFLAAAALAYATRMYAEYDPVFAQWCQKTAAEDFTFAREGHKKGLYTKRWGPVPTAQLCGQGAIAAAELYAATKQDKYRKWGAEYAALILSCQEQEFPDWERPLRGFFYKEPAHIEILNYEHRAHEQAPVCGLVRMCEIFPDDADKGKWLKGISLYREYVLKTAELTAPYNVLPAAIYNINNINTGDHTIPEAFGTKGEALRDLAEQAKQGIRLAPDIYLRRFPLAIQRRGFHATLLSKTKAVSAIGRLLNDKELIQIAINQLEWILGKNPFASSAMYGEGYNYHPLYVAFSPQIIGALPVGIKTNKEHDAPFWPTTCQSVYKEIWGHTSGKFLAILADIKQYIRQK